LTFCENEKLFKAESYDSELYPNGKLMLVAESNK
jgi:hypothetical protein